MTEEEFLKLRKELNHRYRKRDPWGYEINPEDTRRKRIIIDSLRRLNIRFEKALDIGCGEGFITRDLPAQEIYGFDISDVAMSRLPASIIRLDTIKGNYDLVVATAVLYKKYNCQWILDQVRKVATHIILICNIKHREKRILKNPIYEYRFPYREIVERLAIYDLCTTQCWCNTKESKL